MQIHLDSWERLYSWDHHEPLWVLWCTWYQAGYPRLTGPWLIAVVDNEIDALRYSDLHMEVYDASHAQHMHFSALTEELWAAAMGRSGAPPLNQHLGNTANLYRPQQPKAEEKVKT